jgi:hypothetical protein
VRKDVRSFLDSAGKRPKKKNLRMSESTVEQQTTKAPENTELKAANKPQNRKCQYNSKKMAKQAKCYRDNQKLRAEIAKLKRKVELYKKRWVRAEQKLRQNSPTRKVKEVMNKGKKVIEEKLTEHIILKEHLEGVYKSLPRYRDKDVLRRIYHSGKIKKKYRKIMKSLGPRRAYKGEVSNLEYKKKQPTRKITKLKEEVVRFLEKDCNSRMTAGVNETITRNKIKKQKRFLTKSLEDLHKEFLSTSTYKVSYTGFTKLRPFWIMFPRFDKRDTCACKTHENMDLLIKKLSYEKVLPEASSKALLNQITCDREKESCMLRKCTECKDKQPQLLPSDMEKQVKFSQWETITETYLEKKTDANGKETHVTRKVKRTVKTEKFGTKHEVMTILKQQLPNYMRHVYYMNHQYKVLSEMRSSLSQDQICCWVDWGENYVTKMAKEIQSVHFGASRQQLSLHSSVGYSHDDKGCFCTLSECRDHGPPEIMAHLIPVVKLMLKKASEPHHVLFQSDSPVTQYRGSKMFAFLVEVFPEIFPSVHSISWNYTEAGHGKGPVDGVSSKVKTAANDEVAKGKDIDTFQKFVDCAMKIKNITTMVVSEDEIEVMKRTPVNAQTFKGTMNVHQVTWSRENPKLLQFNYLSCFDCPPGSKCQHYHLGSLNYSPQIEALLEEESVDDVEVSSPVSCPVIKTKDWVAMKLSGRLYPGWYIIKIVMLSFS